MKEQFEKVFINGDEKNLPKDRLNKYHCFTKSGNYFYIYGNTILNNSYPIDWYLQPIEPKQEIEAEKGKEPIGDELCEYCPRDKDKRGVYSTSRGYLAGCEGSHCTEAKENYDMVQSLPKEPTPEKCEKCPFFKFYKEPTTKLRDEDIEAWVRVRYNYLPHVINTLSAMRELISDAIKAYCDGKINKP